MSNVSPAPGTRQTPTKAQVAAALSTIGAVLTFLIAKFPDNNNVQTWGSIIVGVLTIVATTYGVYQVPNKPLE